MVVRRDGALVARLEVRVAARGGAGRARAGAGGWGQACRPARRLARGVTGYQRICRQYSSQASKDNYNAHNQQHQVIHMV